MRLVLLLTTFSCLLSYTLVNQAIAGSSGSCVASIMEFTRNLHHRVGYRQSTVDKMLQRMAKKNGHTEATWSLLKTGIPQKVRGFIKRPKDFEDVPQMILGKINRYNSYTQDQERLIANALLFDENVKDLRRQAIAGPYPLRVRYKLYHYRKNPGAPSFKEMIFYHPDEVEEFINQENILHWDFSKFVENNHDMGFLKGRDVEQAELYQMLKHFQRELTKFRNREAKSIVITSGDFQEWNGKTLGELHKAIETALATPRNLPTRKSVSLLELTALWEEIKFYYGHGRIKIPENKLIYRNDQLDMGLDPNRLNIIQSAKRYTIALTSGSVLVLASKMVMGYFEKLLKGEISPDEEVEVCEMPPSIQSIVVVNYALSEDDVIESLVQIEDETAFLYQVGLYLKWRFGDDYETKLHTSEEIDITVVTMKIMTQRHEYLLKI